MRPVGSWRWLLGVVLLCGAAGCPPTSGGGGGLFSGRSGEQWQIVAARLSGPTRIRDAEDLGSALRSVKNIRADLVQVVHQDEYSIITYGRYQLPYEGGTIRITDEIRRDKNFLQSLAIGERFPFMTAIYQRVPQDSIGPPEWDLRQAPGVYSLQIGVFFNTASFSERREAAVEWVRDLRSRGYEAYYYHDAKLSSVTVGSFDESALVRGSARRRNSGQTFRGGDVVPEFEYAPEVIKLMENSEFCHNLINMGVEKTNGVPQPSFLVRIPERDGN